jgi:hypothetical protein
MWPLDAARPPTDTAAPGDRSTAARVLESQLSRHPEPRLRAVRGPRTWARSEFQPGERLAHFADGTRAVTRMPIRAKTRQGDLLSRSQVEIGFTPARYY